MTNAELRELLDKSHVIAVVGHSARPTRTSYRIAQYLRQMGYKVYAVNPTVHEIDGEKSYPSLASIPEHIDIVNVFRRSEHLPGVIEEAIAAGAGAVWAQLGVEHPEAERLANEAGLPIVMNNCIKVSHGMLV